MRYLLPSLLALLLVLPAASAFAGHRDSDRDWHRYQQQHQQNRPGWFKHTPGKTTQYRYTPYRSAKPLVRHPAPNRLGWYKNAPSAQQRFHQPPPAANTYRNGHPLPFWKRW